MVGKYLSWMCLGKMLRKLAQLPQLVQRLMSLGCRSERIPALEQNDAERVHISLCIYFNNQNNQRQAKNRS